MPSPADREAEARADVERIAKAMFESMRVASGFGEKAWERIPEHLRKPWRMTARALLQREVIRVGKRPTSGPPPMAGQTTLDEWSPRPRHADVQSRRRRGLAARR
jgi:hypothetical protein